MIEPHGPVRLPAPFACVYQVHGSGEPLLCIVNVAVPIEPLKALAPLFEEQGLALVTIEWAEPTANDDALQGLEGVLANLGEPSWLLGYSQGACLAQELTLRSHASVRGAILVATRGRLTRFLRAYLEGLHDLTAEGRERIDEMVQIMALYGPSLLAEDALVSFALGQAGATAAGSSPSLRRSSVDMSLAYDGRLAALTTVTVPCIVVAFEHDVVCPPRLGAEVAAAIPSARFVLIQDAGHGGFYTHPQDVLEVVADFVAPIMADTRTRTSEAQ